jgi:hypothetical protein
MSWQMWEMLGVEKCRCREPVDSYGLVLRRLSVHQCKEKGLVGFFVRKWTSFRVFRVFQ